MFDFRPIPPFTPISNSTAPHPGQAIALSPSSPSISASLHDLFWYATRRLKSREIMASLAGGILRLIILVSNVWCSAGTLVQEPLRSCGYEVFINRTERNNRMDKSTERNSHPAVCNVAYPHKRDTYNFRSGSPLSLSFP